MAPPRKEMKQEGRPGRPGRAPGESLRITRLASSKSRDPLRLLSCPKEPTRGEAPIVPIGILTEKILQIASELPLGHEMRE